MKPRYRTTIAVLLVIVGIAGVLTYWTTKPKPTPTIAPKIPPDVQSTNRIASIVYLDAKGVSDATIASLKDMGATQVYLYVASYSDAYFKINQNPYGMANPADALQPAVDKLHQAGMKVVAVISTALLDTKQAPPAGIDLLQPNSVIFDPQKAKPFVEDLVTSLVQYHVDGIYVGEPYFATIKNPTDAQRQSWSDLYKGIIQIAHSAGTPVYMVMPDLYASGILAIDSSGLPRDFTSLGFDAVGIDLEDTYQGFGQSDLQRFDNACKKAVKLNPNDPTVEISLRQSDLKTAVPPEFLQQEVQIAKRDDIKTLLVFANEFWDTTAPDYNQDKTAIRGFLK